MSLRTVLASTVVGALLVMGAVTGGTHATWRDAASASTGTARSGVLAVGFPGPASGSWSAPLVRGTAVAAATTVVNDSAANSKNLRVQLHLDAVTSSNAALDGVLQVNARRVTGSCTAAGSGFKTVGAGYTPTAISTANLTSGQQVTLCLTLLLPASAPQSAGGQSATLTFTVRGQQTRAGAAMGWRTTRTATAPVSTAAIPDAPVLSCGSRSSSSTYSLSWSAVSAATSYTVYRASSNNDASYDELTTTSSQTATITLSSNGTRYYRVTATGAGGESDFSNTLKLVRQGNSNNNFECTGVSP